MQVYYILKSTPVYVYLLFIYLMFIGIKATRERVISSPNRLLIMPAMIFFFSIKGLYRVEDFLLLLIIILVAALINWHFLDRYTERSEHNILVIPGSFQPLLIIILMFSIKYFFGYTRFVSPVLADKYKIMELLVSGVVSGISLSKGIFYYKCAKMHEHKWNK